MPKLKNGKPSPWNAVRIRVQGLPEGVAEVDVLRHGAVVTTVKTTLLNAKAVQKDLHTRYWLNDEWVPF